MTRGSITEYAEAVRGRYLGASKKEKGKILDEFTENTGYHRKAAIRLLHRRTQRRLGKRRGRSRQYSAAAVAALKVAWEATDHLCSKRLQPFLSELVQVLRRHGEMSVTAEVEAELCRMSVSTIERLSRPWRRLEGRRAFSTTKPGSLLKSSIPIRTFADWQENRPGDPEPRLSDHAPLREPLSSRDEAGEQDEECARVHKVYDRRERPTSDYRMLVCLRSLSNGNWKRSTRV